MTDIHSHILPVVDDGSDDFEKSFEMLESAVRNGVDKVILTPHFKRGIYEISAENLRNEFEKFRIKVEEKGLNVKLYLGQEITCSPSVYDDVKLGKVLTLNGGNFVLLEFDFYENCDVLDYCYNLKVMGYTPIIAHVERYGYLGVKHVESLKKSGVKIQINSSSITGHDGKWLKRKSMALLKRGLVDFIASDTHFGRESDLAKCYKTIKRRFGIDVALDLFENNAKILNL